MQKIKTFAEHIDEGVTQFFKTAKWTPYKEHDGKKYFTRTGDNGDYPAIYGEDEVELFKDGYGIEYEFRASRYSDEKAEETVKDLAKDFADVKYIKTYPDEFGGLYRFFVKPKSVNEQRMQQSQFDWQDFDDSDLEGPSWDAKCMDLVNEFKVAMNKEMDPKTYPTHERKQALRALLALFKHQIDQALTEAGNGRPFETDK